MSEPSARVVLLSLDAFPHEAVSPDRTPHLWDLAESGGRAGDGGRCPLPSATYTCHATLLTGRMPTAHHIWSGLAATPRPGIVPGWAGEAQVAIPTLFDACRVAGLRSASVTGDFYLHDILRAGVADLAWPPGGMIPAGSSICAHGYLTNDAVRPHLLAAAADTSFGFLFGHLNESDTVGHLYGPHAPETLDCYAATDRIVGDVLDTLRPGWARTVVIVLADHGMAPFPGGPPVDLLAHDAVREVVAKAIPQGGCGLAHPRPGIAPDQLDAALATVPGVAAWHQVEPELILVEGAPGTWFATSTPPQLAGYHGGSTTTRTLALVGGGHPMVPQIASAIAEHPPHLADWAPTIASILDLGLLT